MEIWSYKELLQLLIIISCFYVNSSSDSEAEKKNTTTPTIDEDEQSKITKGIFGELADMSSYDKQ